MIRACEYRIKRIREELENFKNTELKIVTKSGNVNSKEIVKNRNTETMKVPIPIEIDPYGSLKTVKVTFFPKAGHEIIIYEFNAFVLEFMACVNYIVDLKLRLCDGYDSEFNKTIGQYLHPKNKKIIKDKGNTHKIIEQNYTWIELISKIRDDVSHSYTQKKLYALLKPYKKGGKILVEIDIKIPYILPSEQTPTLINYCENNIQNLKDFKNLMFKEILKKRKKEAEG